MAGQINLAAGADADMNIKHPNNPNHKNLGGSMVAGALKNIFHIGDHHNGNNNNNNNHNNNNDGNRGNKEGSSTKTKVETSTAAPSYVDVPLVARHGSTVSVSIASYPTDVEDEDRIRIDTEFAGAIRGVLSEAYGKPPCRVDVNDYVILRSGQGCASCVCVMQPALGHPCTQFTALWIAAKIIVWARATEGCEVRAGLDGGLVQTIFDAYDLPDVKGEAIESAALIMDCALPGQVLANWETFVKPLEAPENQKVMNSRLFYKVDHQRHDIIIGRGVSAVVQSVIGQVSRASPRYAGQRGMEDDESSASHFGNLEPPEAKWYLSLNPTERAKDENTGVKVKVPPRELLRRHRRVAFVGITHDKLGKVFRQVLEEEPDHQWDRILLLFLSDEKMEWAADSIVAHAATKQNNLSHRQLLKVLEEMGEDMTLEEADHILYGENNDDKEKDCANNKTGQIQANLQQLIKSKKEARKDLEQLLSGHVRELRFLEYDRPFYCASYWDWDEWGGFIHVSPMIWGADPKTCPAMNYHWIGMDPGDDYVAYQDGLSSLLGIAQRF